VIMVTGLVWNVVAKYVKETSSDASAKAKTFCFTSDLLTPLNPEYTFNPGVNGTVDVPIVLKNNDGLNFSELDITYTVTVTPENPEAPAVTVVYSGDRTIEVAEETETVTLKALLPGNTYDVTVVGENGYQQTLKATMIVDPLVSAIYKNTQNNGDHVILTVWTEGTEGTAELTVPVGLIPDATDDDLHGKHVGDTITVSLGENESRAFRFFTAAGYLGGEIEVIHNGSPMDDTPLS